MNVMERDYQMGTPGTAALVGSGRLARALARAMPEAFGIVMVRDVDRGSSIGHLLPDAAVLFSLDELAGRRFDTLWIATSDRSILEVAERIAAGRPDWRGVTAIHSSGAGSIALLAPFTRRNGGALVLHPNGSFTGDAPVPTGLLWTATASSPDLLDHAVRLLAPVAPHIVPLADDRRPLYHAAASVASNYSLALFFMAVDLYRRAGLDDADAREVVRRFMHESVDRGMDGGDLGERLTGPISRGDVDVVARQIAAVAETVPDYRRVFTAIGAMAAMMTGNDDARWRELFGDDAP